MTKQSGHNRWIAIVGIFIGFLILCLFFFRYETTAHLQQFVRPPVTRLMAKQNAVLSKRELGSNRSDVIVYTHVPSSVSASVLELQPTYVWKSCQLLSTSNHCYATWLSIRQMWDVQAKDDPRTNVAVQSSQYGLMRQLENNTATRCTVVATPFFESETAKTIVNTAAGVAYLCVDGPDGIVQFGSWST